ncbi:GTPase [Sanguibacter sp. HDW7]|uniref:GTPase n=1 Tax=Sanguibacter sp. HDW7 TaxID=2714931 RepID=UPI00140AB07F|nr:GTPase [Sanguibacter sp. HDW7]QIK83145.1 GTP-binding protein HSR1 [Sanguibacter sp. HDW7]
MTLAGRLDALEDAWTTAEPWLDGGDGTTRPTTRPTPITSTSTTPSTPTGTTPSASPAGTRAGLTEVPVVVARVRERLGLGADRTVVALAGSTGSGKSSLLNALAGAEVARPGLLRPTTSQPVAASADGSDPTTLLDWLDVRERTHLPESSPLPAGIVLLDLPDHDSVEVAHRVRADRLLERADVMVWVTDPQKYADAALHDDYLRPLAAYGGVAVVVLNHADRLAAADVARVLADLRRRVDDDGLAGAHVLATSATTGAGLPELRTVLAEAARRRERDAARLVVDVRRAATLLLEASGGTDRAARAAAPSEDALVAALAGAAGAGTVVDAVGASTRRQIHLTAGWPVTRWLAGFRADPLGRLGLGAGRTLERASGPGAERRPDARGRRARSEVADPTVETVRSSLPRPSDAVRARAALAVREHVAGALDALPDAWRPAASDRVDGARLADALDTAVVGARLGVDRAPRWARALGVVQMLLLGVVVVGLAWVLGVRGLAYLGVTLPLPELVLDGPSGQVRFAWPAVLVVGGVVLGLLLALVASLCGRATAARRARRARRRLDEAVATVARSTVLAPLGARLDALSRTRDLATTAATP